MLQMPPLKGTPLKIVLTAMVVVLGLFSWMLSPILAIVVLIGMAGLLPIERRARTSLVIIGCLSIGLGAALATGDLPFSQIAVLKLQGSPCQAALSCMV
jgi:predicted cation transporter